MTVWKHAKSAVTGKTTYARKNINTSLLLIFDDFEWWKWFLVHHSLWVFKPRKLLPEQIQKQIPACYSQHMYEYDKRHVGHKHF